MVVQSQLGKGSAMPTNPHHTPKILQSSSSQPQKTHKPRKHTRKVTKVPQPSDPMEHVVNEAVHKELTQSKATPNESSSQGTDSGGGPKRQEAMRDTTAQTRFESVSKHFNDSLLAKGNTLQSDEDIIKLNELMELCTNLQSRVLELEKIKTSQHNEIASLKRRVKKLEKKNRSKTHKLKRLYKVGLTVRVESSDEESLGEDASKQERIDAIDQEEDIALVNVQADAEMFDVDKDLGGEKVFVEQEVVDKEKINEDTLAKALAELKTSKPKAKGGKAIMIEEPVKPKKKDQIRLDEEAALKLQAKFDEEQRLAREKAKKELEANIALIETRDDVQAKINVDYQLAERLQEEEQEELTDAEKATLFMQLLEKRRKHFAKIYKEGKKKYYQIMRADEKSPMYMFFSQMLKRYDREDLEDLYKLVKARYGSTRPMKDLDLLLWGDLKTMFEPHVEDEIWKKQQGYKVLEWKLYDSCGVHFLRMQYMKVFMLVEKTYPLILPTLTMMLEKKLQIDYQSEMAYQLLKLIKKQLKK
uniref:Uncharacterized protein n=1 Tax=Tanacetum cinerariifolium TaxID=118510 RepID=A0A699HB72_TANCI|nr:hypothetical protein [Tanacetum cinerariifolium]